MIVIKAITIGLILLATGSAANICSGRWNGDQLPNPADCGSFYVCNFGEPKLFKCLENLLYDPVKRVCNWAYLVTCGQTGPQEHIPVLPNPPYYPQPQPEDGSVYTQSPIYPNNPTNAPAYTANPPPLIDNHHNVPDYSQTNEFYPGLVESIPNVFHCTNPEFYFAPHPRNCEKYFICENYRIHSHQCGEGIHWDYVFNQCDFPVRTFCYAGPHEDEASGSLVHEEFGPHTDGETGSHSDGEGVSIDHIEHIILNPEHNEEHVEDEFSTMGVTGPIAVTGEIEPAEPVTEAPTPFIECPGTQAFIAHPDDCHKYYICIGGIPIVTSCPSKMAWDKELAQCNEEAWSECFG